MKDKTKQTSRKFEFYNTMVNEMYSKVYSYCYSLIFNQAAAEDLCHDVFLKVKENINTISEKKSYKSYILTMARNKCMDFLRNKRRQTVSLENSPPIGDSRANPEKLYMQKEFDNIVLKSLNQLPEEHKTILVLRDVEGFSYKDISSHLKIHVKRVKWILHKARKKIKTIIGDYYA